MSDNKKTIEHLQAIVTGLSQQATGHDIQSKIFESQGLNKLAAKYKQHAVEERGYVEQCAQRILDLNGMIENQAKEAAPTYTDAIDWIKYDRQVSIDGLAYLREVLKDVHDDVTTYDIIKAYYEDEEKDLNWDDQQLSLIEKIGKGRWYDRQIDA